MCDFSSSIHHPSSPSLVSSHTTEHPAQSSNSRRLDNTFSLVDPEPVGLERRLIKVRTAASSLVQAIHSRDIMAFKTFIQDEDLDPNEPNDDGVRPLEAALNQEDYEMVRLLLRHPKIDLVLIDQERICSLQEDDLRFTTLLMNKSVMTILREDPNLPANSADLKSAYHLSQVATLSRVPKINLQEILKLSDQDFPESMWDDEHYLSSVLDIMNTDPMNSLAGLGNPDRMWANLEQAWTKIAHKSPEYFKNSIDALIQKIHTGHVADATEIANAIKNNNPISFIISLTEHVMNVGVYDNVLVFTDLGGCLNLKTGDQQDDNDFKGKRIIRLSEEDKTRITVEFIRDLQTCALDVIEKIFKMPVIGLIEYKGQKQGNCAATHAKSVWEDQLWFAHIQAINQSPSAFFEELFGEIEPSNEFKCMKRQDLFQTRLEPAVEIFKMLTLEARKQVADQFIKDEHAIAFLSNQLKLHLAETINDEQADQIAADIHGAVQLTMHDTLARMSANQERRQLVKDLQYAERRELNTASRPKKQSEKRMSVKKIANETSRSMNVRQSPRLLAKKSAALT